MADLTEEAAALFERLRAWRAATAKEQGVPAYVIFHDATLRQIAAEAPATLAALAGISGVGENKLAKYGQAILDELAGRAGDDEPPGASGAADLLVASEPPGAFGAAKLPGAAESAGRSGAAELPGAREPAELPGLSESAERRRSAGAAGPTTAEAFAGEAGADEVPWPVEADDQFLP